MTEEQKNKCEKIIGLLIIHLWTSAFIASLYFTTVDYYDKITTDLIISLAKVFNKDITKENAFYIINEILKIDYYKLYRQFIEELYKAHDEGYRADKSVIKSMCWNIANYFDNENKNKEIE